MGKHGMEHPADVDGALDRLVRRPEVGPSRWRHPAVARLLYAPGVEQALAASAPGQRVLDVGAGLGSVARALALAGRHVTALDAAAVACAGARRTLQGTAAVVVEARFGPADGLAAGSFDVIRFGRVLHHVPDLAAAVDHAVELLVVGGRVVVEEFAPEQIDERLAGWLSVQAEALAAAGVALDALPPSAARSLADWQAKVARLALIPAAVVQAAVARRFALGAARWEAGLWPDVAKRIVDPAQAGTIAHRLAAAEAEGVCSGALPGVILRFEGTRYD